MHHKLKRRIRKKLERQLATPGHLSLASYLDNLKPTLLKLAKEFHEEEKRRRRAKAWSLYLKLATESR